MSALPADYDRRTIRQQVRLLEETGLSRGSARLAVLLRVVVARDRELEHAGQLARGRYRELLETGVLEFWRELRACLWDYLERGDEGGVIEVVDEALERVEPGSAPT